MMKTVPIYGREGVVAHALVDDCDFELASGYRWCLGSKGYPIANVYEGGGRLHRRQRTVRMHRLLLGLERGDPRQGDHRNGNVLDNTRSNLRVVTGAQNAQNRTRSGGASRYRGVHHKGPRYKSKPWEAVVRHQGQRHYLGLFATEEEAAAAASAWRAEHMPFSVEGVATSVR